MYIFWLRAHIKNDVTINSILCYLGLRWISGVCAHTAADGAARPTTVLVPLTSVARKVWANVTTTLTRTLASPCWQNDGAVVGSIGLSRARFLRDDVRSRASLANLLLREAQSTCRRSQHGASLSVKWRDESTETSFTWIVAGPTGCSKTTFVARLLWNASTMIDPLPEHVGVDGTQLC